ncbi:hypothetical protein A2U01_0060611, partial [Trifolium medium]|nr:hypothetical protein [Trifolium medium]
MNKFLDRCEQWTKPEVSVAGDSSVPNKMKEVSVSIPKSQSPTHLLDLQYRTILPKSSSK